MIGNIVIVLIVITSISYAVVISVCLLAIWEINTVVITIWYAIAIPENKLASSRLRMYMEKRT